MAVVYGRVIHHVHRLLAATFAIRSDVVTVFCVVVFLLPLVDGMLRIRIGAGWEYYIPLVMLVSASMVARHSLRYRVRINRYFAYYFAGSVLVSISNIAGLVRVEGVELDPVIVSQVHSPIARMIVETIRLCASGLVLLLCVTLVDSWTRLRRVLQAFIYGALLQASYGIYEVVVKLFAIGLPLVNTRSIERSNIVRSYGTFYEPSQFGQFMLIALLCFGLFQAIYGSHSELKLVRWRGVAFGLLVAGLVVSLSRAAFIVGSGCLVLVFVLQKDGRGLRRTLLLVVGILVVFGGAMVLYWNSRDEGDFGRWLDLFVTQGAYENLVMSRILTMGETLGRSAADMIRNPLGIGTGMAIFEYSTIGAPFRFIVEYGVVLTIVGAILFLRYGWTMWRGRSGRSGDRLAVLYIAFTAILFNYNSVTHAWTWLVVGIMMVASRILRLERD